MLYESINIISSLYRQSIIVNTPLFDKKQYELKCTYSQIVLRVF